MEAISETRTTIERGQIAQKLESGYRVCPLRAVMSQRRFPRFSARLTTWARTFIFSILTTEKARFWRRLTDGKGGRNHGGRAADA